MTVASYYTVVLYKSFALLAVFLYSVLMQRLETRLHLRDSQLTKLQNSVQIFLFSFILNINSYILSCKY